MAKSRAVCDRNTRSYYFYNYSSYYPYRYRYSVSPTKLATNQVQRIRDNLRVLPLSGLPLRDLALQHLPRGLELLRGNGGVDGCVCRVVLHGVGERHALLLDLLLGLGGLHGGGGEGGHGTEEWVSLGLWGVIALGAAERRTRLFVGCR